MPDLPPLVLLPGLLCNRNLWAHQLDHLAHLADMTVADLARHREVWRFAAQKNAAAHRGSPPSCPATEASRR